jgi:RNA polymerase sigma-70 factor (ECF subfamily)
MPDESLITRVKNDDREAFDELCRAYYPPLIAYARLFLKGEWAEDVIQDVYFNVWCRRSQLDDTHSLYKYMLRSVYNRSLNYLKKGKYAVQYACSYREQIEHASHIYYDPDNSPVIKNLYTYDLRQKLEQAISALPPKCREVFELSYLQDLSNKEISERLGISTSTVENHIYLALKKLRSMLSDAMMLALLFYPINLSSG